MTKNPAARAPGERFKTWLERVLGLIYERLSSMGINIAGLEVDEEVLATAIPALASEVNTLQTDLAEEKTQLEATVAEKEQAVSTAAADSEQIKTLQGELATAQGELAQVEAITGKLTPVAQEAEKLTGGSGAAGGVPGSEGSPQPPLNPPAGG